MNRFLFISMLFATVSCERLLSGDSHKIEQTNIALKWELVENGYGGKEMSKSNLTFINRGTQRLENKNWELFFNYTFCREIIIDSLPASVRIVHINGDFYKLIPTDKFLPLESEKSFTIPIHSTYTLTKYSDAPGGFYFVFKNSATSEEVIKEVKDFSIGPFSTENQILRNARDHMPLPTAENIFNANKGLTFAEEKELGLIIPTPYQIQLRPDSLVINSSFEIHYENALKEEAVFLSEMVKEQTSLELKRMQSDAKGSKVILLKTEALSFTDNKEAYSLEITKSEGIVIRANNSTGIFYGIQSLRALFPIEKKQYWSLPIPCLEVKDRPEFEYRGMLLDVARNFQPKKNIFKLIDLLSFYKLNKLALQVADDEGWRLEMKGLPELTEIGGRRGHTRTETDRLIPSYGSGAFGNLTASNGFYTQEEYIEIIRYARKKRIEIIPQIDLPGHARAAIKAMDVRYQRYWQKGNKEEAVKYLLRDLQDSSKYKSVQKFNDNVICPCQEGVYNFVAQVTRELAAMHETAGAPLSVFHVGGDEVPEGVWIKSKACQRFMKENAIKETKFLKHYFFERTFKILNEQKLFAASYEDVLLEHLKGETPPGKKEFNKNELLLFSWNNVWGWGNEESSYRLANEGFPMVLGHVTNLYLDLAYTNAPEDPGQYWGGYNDTRKGFEYTPYNIYLSAYYDVEGNPLDGNGWKGKQRLTEKGKSSIKGLQAFLFSETLKDTSMMEYFVFPKILGMAERSWSKTPVWASEENKQKREKALEKDWNKFANTIGRRELPRLDGWKIPVGYYVPAPGAIIQNGYLSANVSFPGLSIRYTSDGSIPAANSPLYEGRVRVSKGILKIASFSSNGRRSAITTLEYK